MGFRKQLNANKTELRREFFDILVLLNDLLIVCFSYLGYELITSAKKQ